MLVLLHGDDLSCYVAAMLLLESYGYAGLKLLVLEDALSKTDERFSLGPLPWCITPLSRETFHKNILELAAFNRANSSAVFLDSVRRVKRSIHSLDLPTSDDTLILKPSPRATSLFLYHPERFARYLRKILSNKVSCTFATTKPGISIDTIINNYCQQGIGQDIPLIFNVTSQNQSDYLCPYRLSRTKWIGINDRNLPMTILPLYPQAKEMRSWRVHASATIQCYEVITDSPKFDISGAFMVSERIKLILANYLSHSHLKIAKL